jgi:hypothetical protein
MNAEKIYMPIFGIKSKIHIIEANKKTCLCGGSVGMCWEMAYGSEIYPQITKKSQDKNCKTKDYIEGLWVANEHAPKVYFCKKCYDLMINIIDNNENLPLTKF